MTCVFIISFSVRMINFRQSVYFGYDEARDAYDSINIYTKGDLKISGPPASAFKGINHGPIYLYFIGPLFLLGRGDPYFVSIIFRLINSLGVLLVFAVGTTYFGKIAGIFASLLFAFSYEQYIYGIFTGNPALSNIFWPVLFIGAGLISSFSKKVKPGLFLMIVSTSFIAQFDLILSYSFLVVGVLLILLRDKVRKLKFGDWFKILTLGFLPVVSYPLAELKNKFLGVKTFLSIINSNFSTLPDGQTRWSLFINNFVGLFKDNILDFGFNRNVIIFLFLVLIVFLFWKTRKVKQSKYILLWIFSMSALLLTNGFMPFYSYAGVGIGVILGFSFLLSELFRRNKIIALTILSLCVVSNVQKIIPQSKDSLIMEIKAQPGMNLDDEINLINKTYEVSSGKMFTIRTTTMPYKVQTTWSYLFDQYGVKKYGYKPFLEGGNTFGYLGKFPAPSEGTTCNRFLIREPVRGIPQVLVSNDVNEENNFSEIVKEENFGDFVLQIRAAKAKDCK
ncbi:MAG: hypothetical protein US39_C0001G0069 [Microgenomates group bacterium GW2011_GWC1_37_12b]|nr:MAG: hypothetical protein US39_C0001G0069 [Microgenomates group bacterium GW2011_GWC1_37_12b]